MGNAQARCAKKARDHSFRALVAASPQSCARPEALLATANCQAEAIRRSRPARRSTS
jgi:hypothetical protein